MSADKAIFTKDPNGNVMVGEPIKPAAAYPQQPLPDPAYYQPPKAFYAADQSGGCAPGPAPPQFYYGPPAGAPPQPAAAPMYPATLPQPTDGFVPNTSYNPHAEVTADFSGAEHRDTAVAAEAANPQATHLNFHDNRLTALNGLEAHPNLLRLTVSWNDLTSLAGVDRAPYLRWIDASGNHIVDFTGMGAMPSLEWLNLTQSDITSFRGLGFAPNLTWLCLHHNRFNDFTGVATLPQLQFLDVSDNEVRGVHGLEACASLREVNLANNPMCEGNVAENLRSVMALSALPNLTRLNITDTFYDKEEEAVVNHFKKNAPKVEVIITRERSQELGHNVDFKGTDVYKGTNTAVKNKKKKKKGCCCQ